MLVVLQHCFQCSELSVVDRAVLTTDADVEEPHPVVDLLRLFSDAETRRHTGLTAIANNSRSKAAAVSSQAVIQVVSDKWAPPGDGHSSNRKPRRGMA